MRFAVLAIAVVVVCGCKSGENTFTPANLATANEVKNPWFLVCGDPRDPYPALLWNGLVGVRFGRNGGAYGTDSKPLPMFWCEAYQPDGEEAIVPLPNPFDVRFEIDGTKPKRIVGYSQVLDMRNAKLTTRVRFKSENGVESEIQCEAVCHPTEPIIAQRWTYYPGAQGTYTWGARATNATTPRIGNRAVVYTIANSIDAVDNEQSNSEMEVRFSTSADPSTTITCVRIVRLGFSSAVSLPKFDDIADACAEYWRKRWQADIVIDGPAEDQQAVKSMLFYLRSATHEKSPMSIAPFGLSDSTYNGHIFWDADMWVFPALALIDPDSAKAISMYRLDRKRRENSDKWQWISKNWKNIKPPSEGMTPIAYPWESSVSGKEVAPADSKKELHVSGDVAWSLELSRALGIIDNAGVVNRVSKLYELIAEKRPGSENQFDITNVMSPDEFHIGDTDLLTNAIAQWCYDRTAVESGLRPSEFARYILPADEKSLLNYANDRVRGYKQAAGVLAIFPIQNKTAESQARVMMERFAHKTTPNGPAMSDSVHATIWARLGESDKAYETWSKGWKEFMKGPLMLFGEKRKKETTYFTTGAAGCIQTVLYGFLGIRIDDANFTGKRPFVPLADGRHLTFSPNLPKLWKSVRLNNFTVLGRRYSLVADHKMAVLTPEGGEPRVVWTLARDSKMVSGQPKMSTIPIQEKP